MTDKENEVTPEPEQEESEDVSDADDADDADDEVKEWGGLAPTKEQMNMPVPDGEHPLETVWSMYFDKKQPKPTDYKNYAGNLQRLGSFNTLEGFWRHYSWLKGPDNLPKGHNLFMFRRDLVPAWETFPKGGTWIIKVHKKNGVISRLWEELLFACIGEMFEEPDVVGVMLSIRGREDLLSVWNSDNQRNPDVRFNIGEKLKEILNLDESTQVEYKHFSSAMRDGSSFRNAKPYVYAAQAYAPAVAE